MVSLQAVLLPGFMLNVEFEVILPGVRPAVLEEMGGSMTCSMMGNAGEWDIQVPGAKSCWGKT